MKKYLPILVVVAILAVAIPLLARHRSEPGLSVGQVAPDFTLQDLDGSSIALSDLHGQVVMVNFWSATCPPCREEMPDMQKVYEELNNDGFSILAVNVGQEPLHMIRDFLGENGYTFPVVKDDGQVSLLYEVQFIPKTLLLDREGVVRFVTVRPVDEHELRELVEPWL
ncbi:MAG: TlpA disulfide reductase family protein [Bacillota bacterium]|nr:TlpA disulfide reductase family protein [Bacillota bacterium]MDW7684028.1 TlpA disulfide reductase family protein [Bacillota bacterium]